MTKIPQYFSPTSTLLEEQTLVSIQTGRSERAVTLLVWTCFCVRFWSEIEIRNQEMLCRERALTEPERKEFWLAQTDEWAQRALNEIASHLQAMAHMGQAIAKPDARALCAPKLCKFFASSADSGRWPQFMALVECSIARLSLARMIALQGNRSSQRRLLLAHRGQAGGRRQCRLRK